MSAPLKQPTAEFSSYYGCYIISMAAFVFFGIIAWSLYSLFSQDKALAAITQPEKITLGNGVEIQPDSEAGRALQARLTAFGEAAHAGQAAQLDLSLDEINAVIQMAPDTGYGTYREMVHVTGSNPAESTLTAELCLPLKKLKFWEGKMRYLIGEGVFKIEVHEEGIDAKLIDVRVPGKEVPAGFVGNLQVWPWVNPYRKLEPLGSMLKGITSAKVTPAGLSLSTQRQEKNTEP